MIEDLDKTIEALLKRELPSEIGGRLTINFASPDGEFPPAALALPIANFFLYRLAENPGRRDNAPIIQRLADGTAAKARPPVYLDCSYLATVWSDPKIADPAAEEHTILGALTQVLLAHPVLPADLLQGALETSQRSPVGASLSSDTFKNPADLWQALGGRPKLSLNYTVTFSMPVFAADQASLVTEKQLRFTTFSAAVGS